MKKSKALYIIILISIILLALITDSIISISNKKNIELFFESEITSIKIIENDKSIIINNNDFISCFNNLFSYSEKTINDLQRGEVSNVCIIELLNNKNQVYRVDIAYSDSNDVFRMLFYNSKSKVIQYNFLKNNFFYEFINLYSSYRKR